MEKRKRARYFQYEGDASLSATELGEGERSGSSLLAMFRHFASFPSGWLHTIQILRIRKRESVGEECPAGKLVESC